MTFFIIGAEVLKKNTDIQTLNLIIFYQGLSYEPFLDNNFNQKQSYWK